MNYLKGGENYDRPFWPNAANATIFEPEAPVTETRVHWRASFVGRALHRACPVLPGFAAFPLVIKKYLS